MAFEVLVLGDEELDQWVADRLDAGDVVGLIDGRAAADEARFHDAIASELDLPDYYGRNWDALDEVLADLDAEESGRPYVLVLRDARWVLGDEPQERLKILAGVLGKASSGEVDPADRSGRAPGPALRVVLHARDDEDAEVLRRRFEAVGADLSP